MSRLTREERETLIRTSDADDTWEVFTDSPRVARLLARRGWKPGPDSRTYVLPAAAVTIRSRAGGVGKARGGGFQNRPSEASSGGGR
jgi:hypothetical protein